MPLISLQDIHLSYGPHVILDRLSLNLYPGEKVGLIGPNGCGKTTLLKILLGSVQSDLGNINKRKVLKIAYLPQEPVFAGDKTMLEELHDSAQNILQLQDKIHKLADDISRLHDSEQKSAMAQYDQLTKQFELAGGYDYETRIKETAAGLGLDDKHFNLRTSQLSGGQLSRLGLAKILLTDANLLLLDEPTNHLDWEATLWLERYLKKFEHAALIVSHDRFLLDRLVTKIIDITDRKAEVYTGNYSTYKLEREKRILEQGRQYQQRVEFIEKTRDFIARNKDNEGMKKVARGRKTLLERLLKENPDYLNKPGGSKSLKFEFSQVPNMAKRVDTILACKNLTKKYDNVTLLENLTFEVFAGQRLGIIGPNGTGKTTLLKLALNHIAPTSGDIKLKQNLTVGYLDQAGIELNPQNTVIQEIGAVVPDLLPDRLRSILGAYLFSGNDVFKSVSDLSGGERNRLALCKLVFTQPAILILDEPTNHLDIPAIEALEQALLEYNGTVIIVSHDRFFLDRVANQLLVLGTDPLGKKALGKYELLNGSISDYFKLLEDRASQQIQNGRRENLAKPKIQYKEKSKKTTPPHLKQFNAWTVEKVEQAINETETQLETIKERFGDEKIYKNPSLLDELKKEFEVKNSYLDLLYQAYGHKCG
ncbi:MAG: ABC-F family ATP-binding cassette domain-containing protein [Candidatus Brocadiia bacterium]|nr:MAG: ABC-F family ATP-binding cassette domain-containing protein [Candidatus Brocadiia bacterium]